MRLWQPVIACLAVILIAFTLLGPSDTTTPTFADVPPQIVVTPALSEQCPDGICNVPQVVESVSYSAPAVGYSEPVYYTSAPSVSYGSTGVSYSAPASTVSYGSTGSVAYAPRTPVRSIVRSRPLRRLAAARPVRSVLRRVFCR